MADNTFGTYNPYEILQRGQQRNFDRQQTLIGLRTSNLALNEQLRRQQAMYELSQNPDTAYLRDRVNGTGGVQPLDATGYQDPTAAPAPVEGGAANAPIRGRYAGVVPQQRSPGVGPGSNTPRFDQNRIAPVTPRNLTSAQRRAWADYLETQGLDRQAATQGNALTIGRRIGHPYSAADQADRLARMQRLGIGVRNGILVTITPQQSNARLSTAGIVNAGQPQTQAPTVLPSAAGGQGALPSAQQSASVIPQLIPGAVVTSAYRSPSHNAAVGGASTSDHMSDHALDIVLPGGRTATDADRQTLVNGLGLEGQQIQWIPNDPNSSGDGGTHLHIGWGGGASSSNAIQLASGAEQTTPVAARIFEHITNTSSEQVSSEIRDMTHEINFGLSQYETLMRNGLVQEAMQLRGQIVTQVAQLEGVRAVQAIDDWRSAENVHDISTLLSQRYRAPALLHQITTGSDRGKWTILLRGPDGQIRQVGTPMNEDDMQTSLLMSVDSSYRQAAIAASQEAQAHYATASIDAQLGAWRDQQLQQGRTEAQLAQQTIQTIGQQNVARIQAQAQVLIQQGQMHLTNGADGVTYGTTMGQDGQPVVVRIDTTQVPGPARTPGLLGTGLFSNSVQVPQTNVSPAVPATVAGLRIGAG